MPAQIIDLAAWLGRKEQDINDRIISLIDDILANLKGSE